jgi:NAD(P)-dependent dehydrogenase (short-subunit alcohol dehydrogenase family)
MNTHDERPLAGQTALVTGGGSGLGAAVCRRLARDGATVVVNDIDATSAETLAHEVGGRAAVFDVCDAAAFDAAVDQVVEQFGRLDIVVNNAGIAPLPDEHRTAISVANQIARFEGRVDDLVPANITVDLSDQDFDRMIKVHLYGTFHGVRAALRHMTPARRGAVVNIASVLALRPIAGPLHYAAAKAAIVALTRSCGQEVAAFGVRVNAVCPGWVDTPLLAPADALTRTAIVSQIPRGRMAEASEIADMVRFLVGPESSYCCGDVLTVSGGVI